MEMDGADDWTTMWIYLVTWNRSFKNVKMVNITYILPYTHKYKAGLLTTSTSYYF